MHKIEYALVKFIFLVFGRLSFKAGKRAADVLCLITRKILRYRRAVILENLSRVYGKAFPAPKEELLRGIYKNFIYLWMEFLQVSRLKSEEMDDYVNVHGREVLDDALKKGRGVIFMSGHYGNFEWIGQYFSMNGYPVNGIAKRQSNPYVNKLVEDIRTMNGIKVVYTKNAMHDGLALLARNELLAIVADQDGRRKGVFVNFLGQPSSTPVGPAVFHLRSGAPILMVISVRKAYGKFDVFIEPVYSGDAQPVTEEAIYRITQKHSAILEKWVRKYPEQWFWMHKRWKTKPPKKTDEK